MEGLSFSAFTRKIYIRASPKQLYTCWATADGLCSWFLREAVFSEASQRRRAGTELAQEGDSYLWKWYNFDGEETGKVTRANGQDTIEYGFSGDSRVQVRLEQAGDKTLVCLYQYNIPTDEESKLGIHYGCSNGWTFWLANLKAWIEHGIVLNEKETDLRKDPLAGFEFVNI